jgi:hypothetical protein
MAKAIRNQHLNMQDILNKSEQQPNGCIEWRGGLKTTGYGRINMNGKSVSAHRYVAILIHGISDSKPNALHSCDNRACVNPDHLRWGTQAENMADRIARNYQPNKTGQIISRMKLTPVQVLEIRDIYAIAHKPYRQIALQYGVSDITIREIVLRITWRKL